MKPLLLTIPICLIPLAAFAQELHYSGEGKVTIPLGKEEPASNELHIEFGVEEGEEKAEIYFPSDEEEHIRKDLYILPSRDYWDETGQTDPTHIYTLPETEEDDEAEEYKICPECGRNMIKEYSEHTLPTYPTQSEWLWSCPWCGHTEKGGTKQDEWEEPKWEDEPNEEEYLEDEEKFKEIEKGE